MIQIRYVHAAVTAATILLMLMIFAIVPLDGTFIVKVVIKQVVQKPKFHYFSVACELKKIDCRL